MSNSLKSDSESADQPERNLNKGARLIAVGILLVVLGFALVLAMRYSPLLGLPRPDNPLSGLGTVQK